MEPQAPSGSRNSVRFQQMPLPGEVLQELGHAIDLITLSAVRRGQQLVAVFVQTLCVMWLSPQHFGYQTVGLILGN